MHVHPGDLVIGLMMAVFALIGLVLAGRGIDLEMQVFGASLTMFSLAFIFGQLRRHFDAADRRHAASAGARHD